MFGRSKPTHSKEPAKAKEAVSYAEGAIFARLKNGLSNTRGRVTAGVQTLVLGEKVIDQAVLDDVEGQLLSADVGLEATDQIIGNLREKLDRKQLSDGEAFMAASNKSCRRY